MTILVSLTNIPRIYAISFDKKVIFVVISWKFRVVTGDTEFLRFKRGIFLLLGGLGLDSYIILSVDLMMMKINFRFIHLQGWGCRIDPKDLNFVPKEGFLITNLDLPIGGGNFIVLCGEAGTKLCSSHGFLET
jgi:hypothetical protein